MEKPVLDCLADTILKYAMFDALGKSKAVYVCVIDIKNDYARWTENAVWDFENLEEYMYDAKGAWLDLLHPEDKKKISTGILEQVKAKGSISNEYRVRKKMGEYIWVRAELSYYESGIEGIDWIIGVIHDTGAVSMVDPLTQLHNIYELDNMVEAHLMCPEDTGALLYIGIDNFKGVNDRYTYAGGNEVIRSFAFFIGQSIPKESSLYRLDGDKFAIFYPGAGQKEVLETFSLVQKAAGELKISGFDVIKLNVTGGAAFYPIDGKNHGDFLRNAEYSLEKAKMVKRNGLLFFSKEMLEETMYRMQLMECLTESVKAGCRGFELHFQPIVNSETNQIVECETLLRFNHPKYPGIRPAEFIPILESTGLITDVGRWILEMAIKKGKKWCDTYGPIVMNVNVSYVQMQCEDFCSYVIHILEKYNFQPELLVLELTESCRVQDMSVLCKVMECLRNHGVNVALDDFGTGYASLSVLRDVPVDWVKIDHNFVKQCKNDKVDRSIVKHIIMLAHSIGVKVCVEGIENADIHSVATEEAADTLQGYFFGKPVRADEFEKMMKKQESQWKMYGYGSQAICW